MKKLLLLLVLLFTATAASAQVTIPNTLVAGTTIRAADLNTNFATLGNASLNRLSGGNISGNVTLDGGITVDGIDISATICTSCTPTLSKLTLSNTSSTAFTVGGGITAGTGAVAIVDTTGKIPALSSTYFASLVGSSLTALNATELTSGTVPDARFPATLPAVSGANLTNIASVPSGAIFYFDRTTATGCPSGYTEFTSARGNYVVGLTNGGTKTTQVGTALTNQENRPAGQHNHGVTDPGHTHNLNTDPTELGGGSGASIFFSANAPLAGAVVSATTGVTVNQSSGTSGIAGTNSPYIQLLVCQKT